MIARTLLVMLLPIGGLLSVAHSATEALFDAAVVYTDGKADTVSNVWEYFDRQPVRMLCYIDGDARRQIPYGEISTVTFSRYDRDPRKTSITMMLWDGGERRGLLWGNDSFFATARDGREWRGRVLTLRSLAFLPSEATSEDSGEPPAPSRSGTTRRP